MKLLIENLKVRYDEFKNSRNTEFNIKDIKLISCADNNCGRLFYYIKDERGNERLHHYCYNGIFISYYDPYIG